MKDILKILSKNGKERSENIAAMTGKTKEEVEALIKEMEEKKIIIKYKTLIDWEKISEEVVYAFIEVKVIPERDVGFDAVARRIYSYPEVHAMYLMAGTYDFAVVVSGKSMKEIAYFVVERLATIEQVQSTATHFVLKRYKVDDEIIVPLEEEDKRLKVSY
ncbi:Lrp/AsnC family transcriptional regulator [bacterium]|nr:Lrp/AsnC family transcriptional regulator [bacterium]MBU0900254.1 Lrp/AsnC family transcriptional regulator [bacterium]MBU1152876.1 Lrp/AsnC family transcriptional regulator [bacterium]MBU1782582.1 Lrp/AsnC family transcriptional regulator [bacterium]MBU2599804.1 Lrp/AsnC family transcriptional regulator [bacterium]